MTEDKYRGGGGKSLLRNLCFIAFGVTVFYSPFDSLNWYNLGMGIVVCLLIGWLYKKFLRGLLSLLNPSLRKEQGKAGIFRAVDSAMLFLIPFAVMILLATFLLGWSLTGRFMSAGIMAVGTAAAIEVGRLTERPRLKNTIVASGVSFAFSFLLTFSLQIMNRFPGYLEGAVTLVTGFLKGGGA